VTPDSIGVVVHPRRDSHALIESILEWAAGHGKKVRGMEEARDLLPAAVATVPPEELVHGCWMVMALGGDGTILRALKLAHPYDVPVLGVNLGRLAFLAEVSLEDLPAALDAIDRGDYRLEERATMHIAHVDAEACDALPTTVFNDSALTRMAGRGPAALAVEVEGQVFGRYTADALVIATPTGSTAYSFAAGGPIVSARHRGLLVTPVAPHAAFDRAVFLHPDESLRVHVLERSAPLLLECDGQRGPELAVGDCVVFRVAEQPAHVVRLHDHGFYERARVKLQLTDSSELAPDSHAEVR
jgi:NAD+ kinase